MKTFKELGLNKKILDVITELEFKEPSEIQDKTIPLILDGKDVIGNASTGSGKTLAFASGIIQSAVPGKGIQALVLTPTRELAEQIANVIRDFSKNTDLKTVEIFGGVNIERQIDRAKKAEIIVGTPGRILDHLHRKTLDFFDLKTLVLDEADRMVDMGFLKDVEKIIGQCPIKRQTLLFSATSSPDVKHIAQKYMKNPTEIVVEKYVDPSKLHQFYYDTPNQLKFSLLVHLMEEEKPGIVLIFCNTRRNVDLIAINLKRYKIDAHAIHGGLDQRKRSRIIEKLHKNEATVLVCTDVAARGLDIKGVSHVYNYDIPKTSEEYIHRIGRTARAGEKGMAISIVTGKDYENFRKVLEDDSLDIKSKEIPEMRKLTPHFKNKSTKDFDHGGGRGYSRGGSRGGSRGTGGSGKQWGRNRDHNNRTGRRDWNSNRSEKTSNWSKDKKESNWNNDRKPRSEERSHSRGNERRIPVRAHGGRSEGKSYGRDNGRSQGGRTGGFNRSGRDSGRSDNRSRTSSNFRSSGRDSGRSDNRGGNRGGGRSEGRSQGGFNRSPRKFQENKGGSNNQRSGGRDHKKKSFRRN